MSKVVIRTVSMKAAGTVVRTYLRDKIRFLVDENPKLSLSVQFVQLSYFEACLLKKAHGSRKIMDNFIKGEQLIGR